MKKFFIAIAVLVIGGIAFSLYTGEPILNAFFSLFGPEGERVGMWIMIGLSIVASGSLIYKILKK